jgi:hypothetical protein
VRRLAAAAAVTGIGAVLAAGYAAAGPAGLIDAASVATVGVLIVARGTLRTDEPASVPADKEQGQPAPAVRAAHFPAYAKIASDLEWAQLSRRHYEQLLRPTLARLAAALDTRHAVNLTGPGGPADADGPGVDRATLERIVTQLEQEP